MQRERDYKYMLAEKEITRYVVPVDDLLEIIDRRIEKQIKEKKIIDKLDYLFWEHRALERGIMTMISRQKSSWYAVGAILSGVASCISILLSYISYYMFDNLNAALVFMYPAILGIIITLLIIRKHRK